MSSYLLRSTRERIPEEETKRISIPNAERLNTIVEGTNYSDIVPSPTLSPAHSRQSSRGDDGSTPRRTGASDPSHTPSVPKTPPSRRGGFRSRLGPAPMESDEGTSPSYSTNPSSPSATLHDAEKTQHGASNGGAAFPQVPAMPAHWQAEMRRRGGWVRLAIIVGVILLVIIALAVGLGVGLTQNKGSSNSSPTSTSLQFPEGSWTFPVVLASVIPACSANANTWSCFPYTVYTASSPTTSMYTFNWNITSTSSSNNNASLQISPESNPFSLSFPATPLVPSGNNVWTFNVSAPKQYEPNVALSGDNARTVCYFNETFYSATLYATGNTNQSSSTASSSTTQPWPGTVYFELLSPADSNSPNCYPIDGSGTVIGPAITGLEGAPGSPPCTCSYESFNGTAST